MTVEYWMSDTDFGWILSLPLVLGGTNCVFYSTAFILQVVTSYFLLLQSSFSPSRLWEDPQFNLSIPPWKIV